MRDSLGGLVLRANDSPKANYALRPIGPICPIGPYVPTALLLYCPTALLPYCFIALLLYCPTALLPYDSPGGIAARIQLP